MPFRELASIRNVKLKVLLDGTSGSGKTMSALRMAFGLAGPDGRVGGICTEAGRMHRYALKFPRLYVEVMRGNYSPDAYIAKIEEAENEGLDVLVIDSVTHEWNGRGGCMEMLDAIGKRSGGTSNAWSTITPLHRRFTEKILSANLHIIVTCRTDTEWVYETVQRGNRQVTVPRKIGMKLQQRPGFEYDYDLWLRLDRDHRAQIEKSLFDDFETGLDLELVTESHGAALYDWLQNATPEQVEALETGREERPQSGAEYHEGSVDNAPRPEGWPVTPHDAAKQPVAPRTEPQDTETTTEPPEEWKDLPDGRRSRARFCSARKADGHMCHARLFPGERDTYNGKEYSVGALIKHTLEKFQRVFCAEHSAAATEYLKVKNGTAPVTT